MISLVFGIAHGFDQGVWSFLDRAGFGLAAAYLAIRTGGLEAAIALHAVGNILALIVSALDGELEAFLLSAEPALTFLEALVDLTVVAVATLVLVRLCPPSASAPRESSDDS